MGKRGKDREKEKKERELEGGGEKRGIRRREK